MQQRHDCLYLLCATDAADPEHACLSSFTGEKLWGAVALDCLGDWRVESCSWLRASAVLKGLLCSPLLHHQATSPSVTSASRWSVVA